MKAPTPTFLLILCVERCGNALPIPFAELKTEPSWIEKLKNKRRWDTIERPLGRLAASGWFMSIVEKDRGWIAALCPECAPLTYPPEVIERAKREVQPVGDPIPMFKLIKKRPPSEGDPGGELGDPDYF